MAKLIFGCGYLGLRVARLWRLSDERVLAVTRTAERAAQLAAEGIEPLIADIAASAELQLPQEVRTVLFAVGYDRSSSRSIQDVYAGGLANVVRQLPETVEKVIYVSSTGVYGQVSGDEVDEDSPCHPTREGGKACLAAEQLLQGNRFGPRSIVLRLAGIYGKGRIPRSADLQAGTPIDAPAAGWLNLIHVEDAARIALLAEAFAAVPRTYVVSDGQPVQRGDYYAELARLLGAPPPRFANSLSPGPQAGPGPGGTASPAWTPGLSVTEPSPAAQRAASDKRVQPRRMFGELKPVLAYPSYREGLAAVVAESA